MPRPRKCRRVGAPPPATFFKPQGVPMAALDTVCLSVDGFEALRLADRDGLDHVSAAGWMGISQPTFSRLLAEARRAVATALADGRALRIEGGNVRLSHSHDPAEKETDMPCHDGTGPRHGHHGADHEGACCGGHHRHGHGHGHDAGHGHGHQHGHGHGHCRCQETDEAGTGEPAPAATPATDS